MEISYAQHAINYFFLVSFYFYPAKQVLNAVKAKRIIVSSTNNHLIKFRKEIP